MATATDIDGIADLVRRRVAAIDSKLRALDTQRDVLMLERRRLAKAFRALGGSLDNPNGSGAGRVWTVLVRADGPIGVRDLMEAAGTTYKATLQSLRRLMDDGKVARVKRGVYVRAG